MQLILMESVSAQTASGAADLTSDGAQRLVVVAQTALTLASTVTITSAGSDESVRITLK